MKEMKEKYITPVTEKVVFEQEDVVTTSQNSMNDDMSGDEPSATGLDW